MDEVNKIENFMKLFEAIKTSLERYCFAVSGNRDDAKDLLHETILQAYSRIHRIKDRNKFPHYIFTIAKRLHLKETKNRSRFTDQEITSIMVSDTKPDAITQLDIKLMQQALNHLPTKLRQAVVLHEISGFSLKEAAKIEECSLSAMKVRVMRGRNKLHDLLKDRSGSEYSYSAGIKRNLNAS